MKRATEYFGLKAVGHNVISDSFSIYAQAIWHLSTRSLVGYLRPGKKGKSQARYEQRISHAPVTHACKSQTVDKPGIAAAEETLPTGALTEIRSISLGEQCRTEVQSHNLQRSLKQMLPALAGFCQQRWLVLVALTWSTFLIHLS